MALFRVSTKLKGSLLRPVVCWKRNLADDSFVRLNIYKDAEKGPKELADEEYPKWLWTLLEDEPTRDELYQEAQNLYSKGGYDAVFDGMSEQKLTRLFRLSSRTRIKNNNSVRAGSRLS